jgi:hypothetical protein
VYAPSALSHNLLLTSLDLGCNALGVDGADAVRDALVRGFY